MADDSIAPIAGIAPIPRTSWFSPGALRRLVGTVRGVVVPRTPTPLQVMRASQFAAVGAPPGRVVMLGDSITELCL